MKFILTVMALSLGFTHNSYSQNPKSRILILASDHLNQIYRKDNPNTDVLTTRRQLEIEAITRQIRKFKPDLIMVERLPERQAETDSLYNLYLKENLNLSTLEGGRSEVYQLGFRLGKQLQLPRIFCVDAPGGTSQGILDEGDNIELYKAEGLALRKIAGDKGKEFHSGKISLLAYLAFLNQPKIYNKIYHLRYIIPARVTNGKFKNPDEMVDTAFINPKYIGAELISVFKNRDFKIYSNIVTTKMRENPERMLLIIGGAHIGSLHNILRDDEEFKIVNPGKYLK